MSRLHRARAGIRGRLVTAGFLPQREGNVKMLIGRLTRSECARVARVLQSYLDGEVDPPTAAMVTAHLEFCRRCGLEASTYRAIKTAMAAGPQTERCRPGRDRADAGVRRGPGRSFRPR